VTSSLLFQSQVPLNLYVSHLLIPILEEQSYKNICQGFQMLEPYPQFIDIIEWGELQKFYLSTIINVFVVSYDDRITPFKLFW
jgi:hypothetical protein